MRFSRAHRDAGLLWPVHIVISFILLSAFPQTQARLSHTQKYSHLKVRQTLDYSIGTEEHVLHPSGGTYPRVTRLSDDSLLAVTTGREDSVRILQTSRSTDGGATFDALGEISRGSGDLDNTFLLELPATSTAPATVLAAFRNHALNSAGSYTYYRITVTSSTDGGKTWKFLAQAAEQAATTIKNGLWEPFMRLGDGGEIQLTYSAELADDNQETFRVISRDRGATWSTPQNLRIHGVDEHLRDGMQGIVKVQDSSTAQEALVIVLETTRRGPFSVEYALSYDDGATWTGRGVVYEPSTGRNAGAPQIARFSNGALVAVFMTDQDSATQHWADQAAIKVAYSDGLVDGKISWSAPVLVHQESSYWPGAFTLSDTEVLVMYENAGRAIGQVITQIEIPEVFHASIPRSSASKARSPLRVH